MVKATVEETMGGVCPPRAVDSEGGDEAVAMPEANVTLSEPLTNTGKMEIYFMRWTLAADLVSPLISVI